MPTRRSILASACLPFAAQAQPWRPERPLQIWAAFAPGGTVDGSIRAIARHGETTRHWSMPVTNRTGGGGLVMANALRAAAPDGLTIGATISYAITLTPFTITPNGPGPDDFTHIARYARADLAICVRGDSAHRSIQDLAAAARAARGMGIAAQGKEVELGIRALGRHLDAPFEPVLVRGGAEGMTQLLGGHVEASVGAGIQAQHVREGRVRELLNLADAPLSLTPTAPTLRALGLDLSVEPQFQIIGPPGMPPAAVNAIATLTEEWLALPESQAHLRERLLLVPRFQGPAETTAATRAETITMRRLLAEFG